MKKEEFPTFLNEQPTVVFGRTTRELLIIVIGIGSGYLFWQRLSGLDRASVVLNVLGIAGGILLVLLALVVAFAKVMTRPLEEWAVILFSYLVLPKAYLYIPGEEEKGRGSDEMEEANQLASGPMAADDDHYA